MNIFYNILYFIRSRPLLKHFLWSIILSFLLIIIINIALRIYTRHREVVVIPNLISMSLPKAEYELSQKHLTFRVLDSAKYNPNYPKYAIINQIPNPGKKVKENRQIYLTINPSDYRKVRVPKIIQVTRRNAISMLRAVGLEVGEVTYQDNIGKDMVLDIIYKRDTIYPGNSVPATSKIDLVCGNGNRP